MKIIETRTREKGFVLWDQILLDDPRIRALTAKNKIYSYLMKIKQIVAFETDDETGRITKTHPCNIQRFFAAEKMTIFS